MAASISFQAETSESGADGALAFTVASAAGQERLLCLCSILDDEATVTYSAVAIDGASATQVGSYVRAADSAGNGAILSFWRAAGTSNTSVSVTYTISGAPTFFDTRGIIWSLNDAGTLLDSTAAIAHASFVITLDVDTISNGVTAAAMLAYTSATHTTTWSGLTERFDGNSLYSTDWVSAADLAVVSGSTPRAVTATIPSDFFGTGSALVAMAVSFNPAGAAAAVDMVLGPIWT